ncbi:hypothetical protein [Criblamydia sequanensis]|uniref:Uncharacterized protein n=1 Tax=Candidatus Criblamydia sequanensis CRIB-18 TaxID=1437425 RepID=A0A090CXW6_9BACT|nr:hypothetical protein [Criblamydia sequanensis]CDR33087.1 hypothetical protein CSEC_0248 [Criblamydia sequanensis CRIB-18]
MFEKGLAINNVDDRLLARLFPRTDLVVKAGFPNLSRSYTYRIKEASHEKFYQKNTISIPRKSKEKILKDIETINLLSKVALTGKIIDKF